MNIIYLLLLTSSLLHCAADVDPDLMGWGFFDLFGLNRAADRFITHAPLPDGMWGTPSSPVKDYPIHLGPQTHPALTEHEVMNPFWLRMKDASQDEKDNEKKDVFYIMKYYCCDKNTVKQRKPIESFLRNILESPAQEDPKPSKALAAPSHPVANGPLPDGMWGAHNYHEFKFDCKQLTELPELIEHEVMNSFWLGMKNASQETKNEALFQVLKHIHYYPYRDARINAAAALWAGSNPRDIQFSPSVIRHIVSKNDIPLVQLLLVRNVAARQNLQNDILFNAKTVSMVKLLMLTGAYDNISALRHHWDSNSTLLHNAMSTDFEPALIPFYRSLGGVSPMETDANGNTPLAILLENYHGNSLLEKAIYLLTNLTPVQKIALLTKLYRHTKGIHHVLEEEDAYDELTAVKMFLKETGKQALNRIELDECPICIEPLHPKARQNSLTPCHHIFHTECLARCLKQSRDCPCCRGNITYSLAIEPSDFYGKPVEDEGKEKEEENIQSVALSSWTRSQGLELSRQMNDI